MPHDKKGLHCREETILKHKPELELFRILRKRTRTQVVCPSGPQPPDGGEQRRHCWLGSPAPPVLIANQDSTDHGARKRPVSHASLGLRFLFENGNGFLGAGAPCRRGPLSGCPEAQLLSRVLPAPSSPSCRCGQ